MQPSLTERIGYLTKREAEEREKSRTSSRSIALIHRKMAEKYRENLDRLKGILPGKQ